MPCSVSLPYLKIPTHIQTFQKLQNQTNQVNAMSELKLLPGPRLVRKSWVVNDQSAGEWLSVDVTDRAHEYLFHDPESVILQSKSRIYHFKSMT
jgi:hypothetical protein